MVSNEENKNDSGIPESSSTKPMDSKRDVDNSPDEKTDQDFPGYPHYPANEDAMDQSTGMHRVDEKVENMSTGPNSTGVNQRYAQESQNEKAGYHQSSGTTALEGKEEEIGLPQNVTENDSKQKTPMPGTDVQEAAEKGSLNP